ncbi:S8 family peptidase [Vallitalea okinawensis]|uniref:S8 family peptidase n=1 Tax=Vallitalea okinawensis TaxID=2078660 RepID=UPI000CFC5D5D|nr:S8 family peptidase [Vallitalea okinawensis]
MRQDNNNDIDCDAIIKSNDYADLYEFGLLADVEDIAKEVGAACTQKLTDTDYIFHIKLNGENCEEFYRQFRYMPIPNIYALSSLSSIETAGIGPVLKSKALDLSGRGVIIGIIDSGIDYTHEAFVYEDNTSKILSIWDQTETGNPPDGFQYGVEYSKEKINEALQAENPLEVVPTTDEVGHGTFIAGVAAGRPNRSKNFSGAAPDSDLVIVKLKPAKKCLLDYYQVKEDAIAFQSNDIMQGLNYLVKKSREFDQPLVVLFAGGSNEGPHNGTVFLEREFADYGSLYGVISVIAAGNEADASHHYHGIFEGDERTKEVQLNISDDERGLFINMWSRLPDELTVEFISPSGASTGKVPFKSGEWQRMEFPLESTEILVNYELIEERTGEEAVYVRIISPTPGVWTIVVHGDIIINGEFDIWLPVRGLINDNTIFLQSSPDTTIVNPSASVGTITIGAFNEVINSLYVPSSRGYTTDMRIKPDLVAPGVNVIGPYPRGQYGALSGTSVAAAITAGACALLLEWGIVKENQPTINTIAAKTFLARGAMRRSGMIYPNKEWGYGELDLFNTFRVISG